MRKNDIDFGNELRMNLSVISGINDKKEKEINDIFDNIIAFKVMKDRLLLTCMMILEKKRCGEPLN